jgi:PhnB protein
MALTRRTATRIAAPHHAARRPAARACLKIFFPECRFKDHALVVTLKASLTQPVFQLTNLLLQGVAVMSSAAVKPIPDGMHSLTPYLICANAADAIKFYAKAFNAVEQFSMPGPGGKVMHACLKIGDSMLMLTDEWPDHNTLGPNSLKGTPVMIHHYVEDVDASFKQAVDAGATVVMPVADMFWGDRYGQLKDPFGHSWSLATHKRDLSPEEIQKNMQAMGSECGPQ